MAKQFYFRGDKSTQDASAEVDLAYSELEAHAARARADRARATAQWGAESKFRLDAEKWEKHLNILRVKLCSK
jgi:hypothetical protein